MCTYRTVGLPVSGDDGGMGNALALGGGEADQRHGGGEGRRESHLEARDTRWGPANGVEAITQSLYRRDRCCQPSKMDVSDGRFLSFWSGRGRALCSCRDSGLEIDLRIGRCRDRLVRRELPRVKSNISLKYTDIG